MTYGADVASLVVPHGFRDPAREQQAVFRAAMTALAEPGKIVPLRPAVSAPLPLEPAAVGLVLTLADYETSLWLDDSFRASAGFADFLRFQTGAKIVEAPSLATFALISDPRRMPRLDAFNMGDPQYPDRSTTLIIAAERLGAERWIVEGPGIRGERLFSFDPAPERFLEMAAENRAAFPLGVDLLLVGQEQVAGLPRSVRIREA